MVELRFLTNAGVEIIVGTVRLLCDPWLVPGAFDGSWWQYPEVQTKPEELTEYTHLYISHIHSDHCDPRTLRRLPNKDVPVFILKGVGPFLKERIRSCGFRNIVELCDRETVEVAPGVVLRMYGAFAPNPFIDSSVPNIIDSSIVVSDGVTTVLNVNDNTPTVDACRRIVEDYPVISVALLPYVGVGPYPSSYHRIEEFSFVPQERAVVRLGPLLNREVLSREKAVKYLCRFLENARVLQPKILVPFAGQMVLGGRQSHKNAFLGVASLQEAADAVRAEFVTVVPYEGDVLDAVTGVVERGLPRASSSEVVDYVDRISNVPSWWEKAFMVPREEFIDLLPLLQAARERLWSYQERFSYFPNWSVAVSIAEDPDQCFVFWMMESPERARSVRRSALRFLPVTEERFLLVTVPYNYLLAVLTRHAHWNNAYHGCHVEWLRHPDSYEPELQTVLSFFHL